MTHCKQCEGRKADGSRCERKVSCDKGCKAYCWQHSKGYQNSTNEVCTYPSVRRPSRSKSKKPKARKSKAKKGGKK